MTEFNNAPPKDVTLHRLVWHPDHYDKGQLTSSGAFPSQDLDGKRFLSVDRADLFDLELAQNRASEQQLKANGETTFRHEARVIDLPCGGVQEITDTEGKTPFSVTSEPEPNNPAHCGIWNRSGKKGRAYINQIRAKLMEIHTKEWMLKY